MKIHHIWDNVFMQNFWVGFGSREEFIKKVKRFSDIELPDKHVDACFNSAETGDGYINFIWFRNKKKDQQIIAHEALHATHFVLDRAGLQMNDNTDEIYCYYLQFLVREINKLREG